MAEPVDVLDDAQREGMTTGEMPDWLDPMRAVLTDDRFDDPGWIFERKLDGVRLLVHRRGDDVTLWTRNRKDATGAYPEVAEAVADQLDHDAVIDGEVVAFEGNRTSFSRLQGRMQKRDPESARRTRIAVKAYLFDLLWLDEHDLRELPLRDRKRVLRAAVDWGDPLRFTTHRNEEGIAYWRDACERGWEGVIAKRASSPYRGSRSRDWLKFKCVSEQELVIGGYTDPEGERTGFGALLVGVHDEPGGHLRYAGKVGTGYDDETLRSLSEELCRLEREDSPFIDRTRRSRGVHWVEPELIAQVGFTEWTGDGRLRHPTFKGLRSDKHAADVVRERPS